MFTVVMCMHVAHVYLKLCALFESWLLCNVLASIVEHYSRSVSDHPTVKFAIEAAVALDSNNFVRFFRLVS